MGLLAAPATPLCAVLDVGKTHLKLLLIDAQGQPVAERRQRNAPVWAPQGYLALDTAGTGDWVCDALAGLGALRGRITRLITTTHGAAFAALKGDALALPVPDYEFEGFDAALAPQHGQYAPDAFEHTLSPRLPCGLNAATQFDWLARHAGAEFDAADTLLPYPQYWAWWACGTRASELSSLGCHTQLWRPREQRFSDLAQRRGWAQRFAPLRPAWQVLGTLRPALARRLGLSEAVQVHGGVHDSNACLASHLRATPALTLVSTGTWTVVMAPGADPAAVDGTPDLLAGVAVDGDVVPTGRFMGGRELQVLLHGADPAAADPAALAGLLGRQVMALPAFVSQGGPFAASTGCVTERGAPVDWRPWPAAQRAALAQLYAADVTAWLVQRLRGAGPVIVEGPCADSPVFLQALDAVLGPGRVCTGGSAMEGTAHGAWLLTRWDTSAPAARHVSVQGSPLAGAILRHHQRWSLLADARVSPPVS